MRLRKDYRRFWEDFETLEEEVGKWWESAVKKFHLLKKFEPVNIFKKVKKSGRSIRKIRENQENQ